MTEENKEIPKSLVLGGTTPIDYERHESMVVDASGRIYSRISEQLDLVEALARHCGITLEEAQLLLGGRTIVKDNERV